MLSAPTDVRPLTIALIGNPNTGKSTLFNALTGGRAQTGNYPGVTVEKKIGRLRWGTQPVSMIDLPGTYSLSPRSLDEMVSVNVLLGRQAGSSAPDAVICIVDSSNLERNLYLISQVLDLRLPTVLVLNMADVATAHGLKVDVAQLSERLGVPVVTAEAHRRRGLAAIEGAVRTALASPRPLAGPLFPSVFYEACGRLREALQHLGRGDVPDYLVQRLILDVGGEAEQELATTAPGGLAQLQAERQILAEQKCVVPAIEARVRYQWIRQVLAGVLVRPATRPVSFSDKLDRVLTHRFSGLAIFIVLMFVIFEALYTGAQPLMNACEAAQGWLADRLSGLIDPGPLRSLVVDGIVGGVGSVLVFLPQIVILFLFIAVLEDCGYMARAAFLMDRLMTKVGLSGKSFVPLMSSFACAIPGIMATRVIENRRDRLTTILVAPLMSCSARQPVYALMIAGFVPAISWCGGWLHLQAMALLAISSLGAVVAAPLAWLFKGTLFRGETPPFVMELPCYKRPSVRIVVSRAYDQAYSFVARAGSLIFCTSLVIWGLSYFPEDHRAADVLQVELERGAAEYASQLQERDRLRAESSDASNETSPPTSPVIQPAGVATNDSGAREAVLSSRIARYEARLAELTLARSRLLEESWLGRAGRWIEPVVRPLGWDWKIGVGVIASFPAREVIIGTLGTIYSVGGVDGPDEIGLQGALQAATWPDGSKVYTLPVAVSIMVFFALCAQCASTLMVIKRETNSWYWPLFTFTYMTALAYAGAWLAYQAASHFV